MTYAGGYRDPTDVVGPRIGAAIIDAIVGWVLLALIAVPLMLAVVHGTTRASEAQATAICDRINGTTHTTPGGESIGRRSEDETRFCVPVGDKTYILDFGDIFKVYGIAILASWVTGGLNTVLLQGLKGGTVGKLAVGLRVVKPDGSHAGVGKCLLRSVVGIADGQCFIGLILMCVTKGHRRLADMAAGTFVVRKVDVGRPVVVPGLNAPPPWGYGSGGPGYGGPGYGGPGYGGPGYGAPGGPGYGPPGYGVPGYGAPGYGAAGYGPPPAATTQRTAPTTDGPHWDEERGAYIQYDRDQSAWLQWSEVTRSWGPIDQ